MANIVNQGGGLSAGKVECVLFLFLFHFFLLSCHQPEKQVSENQEETKAAGSPLKDPRIEGDWFVYGYNDLFRVSPSTFAINDGRGNDYPSGNYQITSIEPNGGSGTISLDGAKETFTYRFEEEEIQFYFQRIGQLRCKREKWISAEDAQ